VVGYEFVMDLPSRVLLGNDAVGLGLDPNPNPGRAPARDRFDEARIGLGHLSALCALGRDPWQIKPLIGQSLQLAANTVKTSRSPSRVATASTASSVEPPAKVEGPALGQADDGITVRLDVRPFEVVSLLLIV
jgi:hypothetical protein